MPPKRVSICGQESCPGRRACRACRRIVEAKRRAERKANAPKQEPVVVASLGSAPASAAMNLNQGIDLSHVTPGLDLKPREASVFTQPVELGWCKRCGELTPEWYKRNLDQSMVRLCRRCQRESEAEAVQ